MTGTGKQHQPQPEPTSHRSIFESPHWMMLFGGLMMWAAYPPIGIGLLALAAPLPWLLLVERPELKGKRPYLKMWGASFVCWMLMLHFVRLPHWTAYFGWVALSAYASAYWPVFIGLSRVALHRYRIPIVVAAPMVWSGLEFVRCHFATGFPFELLGHALVKIPVAIQVLDIAGVYGLSLLMMFVTACVVPIIMHRENHLRWLWMAPIAATVAGVLLYGTYCLNQVPAASAENGTTKIGLIQGSIDTVFPSTEEQAKSIIFNKFNQYRDLTLQAISENPDLDLIVWPESAFPFPNIISVENKDEIVLEKMAEIGQFQQLFRNHALLVTGAIDYDQLYDVIDPDVKSIPMLLGTQTSEYETENRYNSALLVDRHGVIADRYDKMHRVMFGEYVPFGEYMPWVYHLTPMETGLTRGTEPVAMRVGELTVAPNICFESLMPHVMRYQFNNLLSHGKAPDALINISNDGWFWGSSALDHHLASNIVRAVELRRPMLVAANTGFSAHVDAQGRVLQKGPRRDVGYLIAEVRPESGVSLYSKIGDWPFLVMALGCGCLVFTGLCQRWGNRKGSQEVNATPSSPS